MYDIYIYNRLLSTHDFNDSMIRDTCLDGLTHHQTWSNSEAIHVDCEKTTANQSRYTPPKFNMEPENDGFQEELPFLGTSFQVPC